MPRAPGIAGADVKARDELGIGVDGRPRPDGAHEVLALAVRLRDGRHTPHRLRYVLVLRVAEAPDLVALEALAREVDHDLALVVLAHGAEVGQKLEHRPLCHAGHAARGADGVALAEGRHDLGASLRCQLVHAVQYACSCRHGQVPSMLPAFHFMLPGRD